jgi:ribosomal protein S18 acetylase RimI-like enzyme
MNNLQIKTLTGVPAEKIHEAFIDAFSEYEVPIDMPLEKLQEMMVTRDLNPDFSVGCFDGDKLVGFILTGYRERGTQKTCYDGGTGVIKAYQRKGIGEMMLQELLMILHEKQICHFVLEVLENNTPAIKLYEKHGFAKTRKLECFEIDKDNLPIVPDRGFGFSVASPATMIENEEKYSLYTPTWQNETRSVINVKANYTHVTLSCSGKMLCHGYVHKTKGDIPQIGILEEWKHWGLEAHLIKELAKYTENKKLMVLNVEGSNYMAETLRKLGFSNFVNQYEMVLKFYKNENQ